MRIKIIEVGIIFMYTHAIYVTIPYMEYILYDDNRDKIAYDVYSHQLIMLLLILNMWHREFDTNHNRYNHIYCSFCPEGILDHCSPYHPGISILCVAYVSLVPILSKCAYGNIHAYKSHIYHILRVSQYWSIFNCH